MEETPCFAEADTAEQGTTSKKPKASHETLETESTIACNSEHDFHFLRTKLCLLEYALEQQRTTSNNLKEERDEAMTLNSSLQREVDELRREVQTGKLRSSSELPQFKQQSESCNTGPLKEKQTVVGCIVALPGKCVRGLVKRVALFVWWTGVWANEGLGMLRIENKWVELQQLKCELEQDNARLLQQVYDLQKQLTEKEVEIFKEIERSKELTDRLINCGTSCSKSHPLEKMAKQVHAVRDFSESLSDEIERIKATTDRRLAQFEKVYHDVDRLSESQRLLEITERNLERRVKNLADAMTHDCHCFGAGSSQARKIDGKDETDKEKAVVPDKATQERTPAQRDENKSRVKALKRTLSSVYGVFCCGFRAVVVFLLTFLVTGILFHFLLVSSSLRLPSSPAEEYYGVDLFALWSFFINWLFCLLVTE